ESVFDSRSSDVEDSPVYDRFAKVKGMHSKTSESDAKTSDFDSYETNSSVDTLESVPKPVVVEPKVVSQPKVEVPPPMTGNYMPPKSDFGIDDVETLESVPKPVVVEPKVVSQPKVWPDAPIIEEYESDSDDKYVIKPSKEQEKPSFSFVNAVKHDDPQKALKNKGIVDSGCSRHMTGNKAYLVEYQDYNGGPVAFGGSKGYISGKGKIKTGKLDFEDVCFVKELHHFNLFSVSQMCDKKNKVLFTDTECLVLSPDFKLPNENQVLLRVPRQNNMNIVPTGGLACLIAKAIVDESNKWHRRLDHVNFKNLNKLVKGNLVRGLPSKIFQNDHTYVACQKGKQHKAHNSRTGTLLNSVSQKGSRGNTVMPELHNKMELLRGRTGP
ncbi:ribonuclease H-like domain-containing protein, partial [Tanacetum coccineum]